MCAYSQSFKYLKRGEGIEKRFGRINYPVLTSKQKYTNHRIENINLMDNTEKTTDTRRPSSDSGLETYKSDLDAVSRNLIVKNIREKAALFSPESVVSSNDTKENRDHSIDSEVNSFEVFEQLAETSINSNSSIIHKVNELIQARIPLLEGNNKFNHRLSTLQEVTAEQQSPNDSVEALIENARDKTAQRLATSAVDQIVKQPMDLNGDDNEFKSSSNNSLKNGISSSDGSVKTDDLLNGFVLNIPSTLLQVLNEKRPMFNFPSDFDSQREPLRQVNENSRLTNNLNFLNINGNDRTMFGKHVQDHARTLKLLEKRLRSKIDLLEKDANGLTEVKFKLEEREKELDHEANVLRKLVEEFEARKEKELNNLRKEYLDLQREQSALAKEQNLLKRADEERVNLLKSEIIELKNRLCEKDASVSGNNYRITELQKQLAVANELLKTAEIRYETLNDQIKKVTCENAQLRNQLYKLNLRTSSQVNNMTNSATMPNLATNNSDVKKCEQQTQKNDCKTVRFNLPDETLGFKRTFNRSIQTTNFDEISTQTSLVIENGPELRVEPQTSAEHNTWSNFEERKLADGTIVRKYQNGDTQTLCVDRVERHYIKALDVTQVFNPDGATELQDNTTVWHKIIHLDGRRQVFETDGTKITVYADGTLVQEFTDGDVQTKVPGKYTKNVKKNGDVKCVYDNNWKVTRLSNGRVRIKDPNDKLVKDEIVESSSAERLANLLKPFGVKVP